MSKLKTLKSNLKFVDGVNFRGLIVKGGGEKSWDYYLCVCACVQVVTCVFVPKLADTRCRGRRGAVSPGKEKGRTFYREETLADTGRENKRL